MSPGLLKKPGRREVGAALGAAALPARGRAAIPPSAPFRRVRPGEPGWPDRRPGRDCRARWVAGWRR